MIGPSGEWEDFMRETRAEGSRQLTIRRLAREVKRADPARGGHIVAHILGYRSALRGNAARGVATAKPGLNLNPAPGNRVAALVDWVFSIGRRSANEAWDGTAASSSQRCEAGSGTWSGRR